MLSGSVDTGEWLLVKQGLQPVSQCNAPQCCHHQLIVVHGEIGLLEIGSHLELTGSHFVVSGGDRNAELVKLELRFRDAALNSLRNAAEVVILELLAARWRCANESASAHHEVRTHPEMRAVDKEILLLGPESREHPLHSLIAEQVEKRDRSLGKNVGAAKEWCHFVECFTVVADEHRRD